MCKEIWNEMMLQLLCRYFDTSKGDKTVFGHICGKIQPSGGFPWQLDGSNCTLFSEVIFIYSFQALFVFHTCKPAEETYNIHLVLGFYFFTALYFPPFSSPHTVAEVMDC